MRLFAALFLSAALASVLSVAPAQAQQCPIGSYPWVDSWGNKICKRHGDGSTARAEAPKGQACPTGSTPWTDVWGNKICRSQKAGKEPQTDYYDTSKGCPIGTHEWVDERGNKVCKKL